MTTPDDDNNRLLAGTLPRDPEADAEPVVVVDQSARASTTARAPALELDVYDGDADNPREDSDSDETAFGDLGDHSDEEQRLPSLESPKLRPDDPRLAVPQPELTRWRRGYVVAGLAAVGAVLAGSVVLAGNQGRSLPKRDARLDLYAHPSSGLPDAIAKLTSIRSANPMHSEEEQAAAAPVSEEVQDEEAQGEDEALYDEEDTNYEAEDRARYYGRDAPLANPGYDEGAAVDDEALPPMAMKEAKGSGLEGGASARGDAPGGRDLGQPPGAGGQRNGELEQRDQPPADDEERKERFMARGSLPDLTGPLQDRGVCELDAGTPIAAYLETAINTDLPGQGTLKATVTKAVLCGPNHEFVAIPQGATFSGSSDSRVAYGQSRVLFCWHRLYLPKSRRHPLGAKKDIRCVPGAEATGEIGLEGEVDNHWAALIGGVAISTFMSLGTSVSAGNQTGYAPTIGQQLARGAGQNISAAGDRIAQRELMRKPTVRQGPTSFAIILNADMELEPFAAL